MPDLSIPNLPVADLPLIGNEIAVVSQNGTAKRVLISDLPATPPELTVDELAAVQGANAPDGTNVFATIDDLPVLTANVVVLTRAALQTLISTSAVSNQICYEISNAVGNTKLVRVFGLTTTTITSNAYSITDGTFGTYDITTDVYAAATGSPDLATVYAEGNVVDSYALTIADANGGIVGITKGTSFIGSTNVVAFGEGASTGSAHINAVAIGDYAASSRTGTNIVALGNYAGNNSQGSNTNALGLDAGRLSQVTNLNAFGNKAAYAIGTAISNLNALGSEAARGNLGNNVNALGNEAARDNIGTNVNALGNSTAYANTGSDVNALGNNAANGNIGSNVNALGIDAAGTNTGQRVNAFGNAAALSNTSNDVNAFGDAALAENTGFASSAIGKNAGRKNSGGYCTFIGENAGYNEIADNGNSLASQFVIANTNMPSYADRTAATTAITVALGAIAGNTYLYYNEDTFAIEGVRL